MEGDELRKRAKKRVDAKLGFRKHLQTYVFVNVLLAIINLVTSPHTLWFLWVVAGWGIAIAFQWWSVYGPRPDVAAGAAPLHPRRRPARRGNRGLR